MNWEDIFHKLPKYGGFKDSKTLRMVFDALSEKEVIDKMIEANDIIKKPALLGALRIITDIFRRHPEQDISLDNQFVKSFIGALITAIMKENGYVPKYQKNLGKANSEIFKSGLCYQGPAVDPTQTGRLIELTGEKKITRQKNQLSEKNNHKSWNEAKENYRINLWDKFGLKTHIDELLKNHQKFLKNNHQAKVFSHTAYDDLQVLIDQFYGEFYITPHQIALELLNEHPGLLEAGSISLCGINRYDEYTFIDLISDNLSLDNSDYKMIEILPACDYLISLEYNGYDIFSKSGAPIKAFKSSGCRDDSILRDSDVQSILNKSNREFSKLLWEKYNIHDSIKKILEKYCGDGDYLSFNQAAVLMFEETAGSRSSNNQYTCDSYPFYPILLETMARTTLGEIDDIEFKFISTAGFKEIYYKSKDGRIFNGNMEFLPVIKLK